MSIQNVRYYATEQYCQNIERSKGRLTTCRRSNAYMYKFILYCDVKHLFAGHSSQNDLTSMNNNFNYYIYL